MYWSVWRWRHVQTSLADGGDVKLPRAAAAAIVTACRTTGGRAARSHGGRENGRDGTAARRVGWNGDKRVVVAAGGYGAILPRDTRCKLRWRAVADDGVGGGGSNNPERIVWRAPRRHRRRLWCITRREIRVYMRTVWRIYTDTTRKSERKKNLITKSITEKDARDSPRETQRY